MFTLCLERSKYFRVKRGQTRAEIEEVLKTPIDGELYSGRIITLCTRDVDVYSAKVGDNYRIIAEKFAADEEELKRLNKNKPVYPTCKVFVPKA